MPFLADIVISWGVILDFIIRTPECREKNKNKIEMTEEVKWLP